MHDCSHCGGSGELRLVAVFAETVREAKDLLGQLNPGDRVIAMDDVVEAAGLESACTVEMRRCGPLAIDRLRNRLAMIGDADVVLPLPGDPSATEEASPDVLVTFDVVAGEEPSTEIPIEIDDDPAPGWLQRMSRALRGGED